MGGGHGVHVVGLTVRGGTVVVGGAVPACETGFGEDRLRVRGKDDRIDVLFGFGDRLRRVLRRDACRCGRGSRGLDRWWRWRGWGCLLMVAASAEERDGPDKNDGFEEPE